MSRHSQESIEPLGTQLLPNPESPERFAGKGRHPEADPVSTGRQRTQVPEDLPLRPSLLRFLSAAAGSIEKPFLDWRQVSRLSEGFLGPGARAKPVTEKGISESALGLNGLPKSKRTRKVRPD